jgi:ribosomal-protein-alanine N-acetyltransferase
MFTDARLETARLIIRPFKLQDAEALQGIVSQTEVMRYLPEDVMSLDEVKEIILWLNDCYRKNTPECIMKFTLAVIFKENGKLIGWCGLGPLDFSPSEIEIFYGLSSEYWGKGIATEAAKALLHYGFDTIGLNQIVAVTNPLNTASIRVIENLGLMYRRKVEKLPEKHSSYEGCLYYSLSRDEYSKMRTGG